MYSLSVIYYHNKLTDSAWRHTSRAKKTFPLLGKGLAEKNAQTTEMLEYDSGPAMNNTWLNRSRCFYCQPVNDLYSFFQ